MMCMKANLWDLHVCSVCFLCAFVFLVCIQHVLHARAFSCDDFLCISPHAYYCTLYMCVSIQYTVHVYVYTIHCTCVCRIYNTLRQIVQLGRG